MYPQITKRYSPNTSGIKFALSYVMDDNEELIHIENDKAITISPQLQYLLMGTTGMAAGNTIIEAINQGLSEIIERHVQKHFYWENLKPVQLDLDMIKEMSVELKTIIDKLIEKNTEIRIYDFSFQTGLPVICVLMIYKTDMTHHITFGSFPVLEIAIERCLTESLQGRVFTNMDGTLPCAPFTNIDMDDEVELAVNANVLHPEKQFINCKNINKKTNINNNVYIDSSSTNAEIFKHYVLLMKQMNVDVYYKDMSLCPDIKAIRLHSPQLNEHNRDFLMICEEFPDKEIVKKALTFIDAEKHSRNQANDLINTLENADFGTGIFLRDLFTERGWEIGSIEYIVSVLFCYLMQYDYALDVLKHVENHPISKNYPEIGALKTYLHYKCSNIQDNAEIELGLRFWGINENYIKALIDNDELFLETFLSSLKENSFNAKVVAEIKKIKQGEK